MLRINSEGHMKGGIYETIVTPIDMCCRRLGCSCVTTESGSVLMDSGYKVALEAGPLSRICNHPCKEHDILGPSKNDTEWRHV